MKEAVIVAAVRTPIGDFGGSFRDVMAHELAIPVIKELLRRTNIPPQAVEEVILGNCIQRADEANPARVAALKAGLPKETTAMTIQRQCSSGMQAVVSAIQEINLGLAEVVIAGGTESMSTAPYVLKSARWGQRLQHGVMSDAVWDVLVDPVCGLIMGLTAEKLAEKYGITREEQDEVAFRSHKNAIAAIDEGRFREEIVPVPVKGRKGEEVLVNTDEHPRRDISREGLARLRPTFKEGGTVTAGNSSGINDGAAALLLMSREKAEEFGLEPLAKVLGYAWAGVEPDLMGYGPVPATRKVLSRTGLTLDDMDLIELNEAFAAQYLACEKLLELPREKTNVNGSGVGLGHPVGCTGARILVTLIHELKRRGLKIGLATLCVGGGMGMSMVVELERVQRRE
ncbi:MAG: thiolase family protein [Clostridia bacterium]|nr:thiolase family protein [Clostridia bacterium]